MNDKDLKKRLQNLDIPEPSAEAVEKTVRAALAEFQLRKSMSEHKEDIPPALARIIEKQSKGGFSMQKFFAFTGILFGFLLLFAVMLPNYGSFRSSSKYQESKTSLGEIASPTEELREYDENIGSQRKAATRKYDVTFGNRDGDRDGDRIASAQPGSNPPMSGADKAQNEWRSPDQTYAGRDRFESPAPNPVHRVPESPVSTFSIDVDTASYAFVRRALNQGHLPPPNAVRIEELVNYFDYDYELPEDPSIPFKPTLSIFPTPWNPNTRLLHIGIKGFDIAPDQKQRSNLVFLIDVSGSMNQPDKLPLLKDSLSLLVNHLNPDDTIAMVVYAGSAGVVLEPTRVRDKHRILNALDRLRAGGSTAGGAGIKQAYALAEANFDPEGVNRVILATDGDFNVGIRDPEALKGFIERKRDTGVFLSVLGFGQGNYNDALMQKLAQNGNGNAAYIDTLSEARKVLVEEASSTLFTIARDVKIQVEFNPARVAEYRLVGYETRRLRREDFNNDRVDAGDVGPGHSVTALYEITLTDAGARLIDDLRYGSTPAPKPDASGKDEPENMENEYAFLKIRYKLPNEDRSRLMTTPVDDSMVYTRVENAPRDVRFSAAVAGFGLLLRGDPSIRDFSYEDVLAMARPATGEDPFGHRSEFLELVQMAEDADAMGNR